MTKPPISKSMQKRIAAQKGEEWNDEPFLPDWVSPPGDTIRSLLRTRNLTRQQAADKLELTLCGFKKLLVGSMRIDQALSEKLETHIGGKAAFWVRRDQDYVSECMRLSKPIGKS